ncbi:hypothetical protein ACRAWD_21955 [Caulobacter segnis]
MNSLAGSLYVYGAIDVQISKLSYQRLLLPSQSCSIQARRSRIQFTEADKVLDNLIFEDCELVTFGNGPATNLVWIKGGSIQEAFNSNLTSRRFVCEEVLLDPAGNPAFNQMASTSASPMTDSAEFVRPKFITIDPRETYGEAPAQTGMTNVQFQMPAGLLLRTRTTRQCRS